jgi:RNA polymerase sigma factor (TIGR02999 family)
MSGQEKEMTEQTTVTDILVEMRGGNVEPLNRLIPLVYGELRRIAHRELSRERDEHTLGTTGLVNEAYLKLVDQTRVQWSDRAQFFGVAAGIMRRILVDYARKHRAAKRGGDAPLVPLLEDLVAAESRAEELVILDEALNRLAELDPRLSRVVECRYFGGLTDDETAEVLGVTSRTVRRDWVKAKGWLYQEMQES